METPIVWYYISKLIRVTPEDFMSYARPKTTSTNKVCLSPSSFRECSRVKASYPVTKYHGNIFSRNAKRKCRFGFSLHIKTSSKFMDSNKVLTYVLSIVPRGRSGRYYLQKKNEGYLHKEMIVEFLTSVELPSRLSPFLRFTTSLKGWNTYTVGTHQWSMAILTRSGKIFIDESGHTKIGEFGLTALCYHAAPLLSTVVFTGFNRWMSPELFNFEPDSIPTPTLASDIWALACTIFEIISEKLPYPNYKHDIRVQRAILKGERPGDFSEEVEGSDSPGFWAMLESCWAENPLQRPSMTSIMESYPQSKSTQSSPNQPPKFPELMLGEADGEREETSAEEITERMEEIYTQNEEIKQMQDRADAVMEEFEKSLAIEREAERVHREAIAARKREQRKVQALIDEEMIDEERKKDVQRRIEKQPTSKSVVTPRFGVDLASTGESGTLLRLQQSSNKLDLSSEDANIASTPEASTQDCDPETVAPNSQDARTSLASLVDDDPVLSPSGDPIISPTTLRVHFKEVAVAPPTRQLMPSLLESSGQTDDLVIPPVDAAYNRVGSRSISHCGRLTGMRTSPYPLSPSQGQFHGLYSPSAAILHQGNSGLAVRQNLAPSTCPQPSTSGGGLPPPPRQKPQNQSVRSPPRTTWVATSRLRIGLRSKTSWEQYRESRLGFDDEGTEDEDEDEDGENEDQSNWAWATGQRIHKHMPSFLDLRTRRQSQL
ncbi:unnamed protein product [Rhizoctonia solani]|uniref:Protein kinase domain-containing protein n=1 Tax=Rhizoctonia solani TaxID=456999 RepID=A0A8H2XSX0_9AGAM|nr:unnamed protein product [Rhizoctonia solani]